VRVACLFDIHGNLPALDAVLDEPDVASADLIVAGGDVAWGPMPAETLDRLAQLGKRVRFVRGNCDRELADAYERWAAGASKSSEVPGDPERVSVWAATRLSPRHRDLLASFEVSVTVSVDSLGEVLLCHATPRSDEEIVTALTDDAQLAEALAVCSADVVVAGHTHVQLDRSVAGYRFLNAGSTGMPYEDEPGAYWLLLGTEASLRRTSYDYDAAAELIRASGYPRADELVQECLLEPIGAAEAVKHFDRIARGRNSPFSSQ
jgi:predicted phosphodiesterase